MTSRSFLFASLIVFSACSATPPGDGSGGGAAAAGGGSASAGGGAAAGGGDAGSGLTCRACVETSECGVGAACVQYAGADHCGKVCTGATGCAADETCVSAVAEDGTPVSVCAPTSGTCPDGTGCSSCAGGQVCDLIAGECVDVDDGGTDVPLEPEPDAGPAADGGRPDAGRAPTGVGPDGGTVRKLYFAVVGDTRPPGSNDTNHYPTATITKIYDQLEALSPRPQFVVATGDYQFAAPGGNQGELQIQKYLAARGNYSGTVFASMGNHECGSGGVTGNCAGSNSNNYQSYLNHLVKPLGKNNPNYMVRIDDPDGKWTAKLVIVACNSWTAANKTWLTSVMAQPTTYTFLARHEPLGTDAPCGADMDALLRTHPYTLLMVGHIHRYSHSGRQLLEGVGGAPLTGASNYGYATVEQLAAGGFRVRQYDAATKQVVSTFTVP